MIVIARMILGRSMTMMTTMSSQISKVFKEVESEYYVLECELTMDYVCRTHGSGHISGARIECARNFASYNDALEFSKSWGWFDSGFKPVRVRVYSTFYRGV